MRFNFPVALTLLALAGCAYMPDSASNDPERGVVGKPITSLSAMNDAVGSSHVHIALFDKNVRLIHEFDLTDMTAVRTMTVDDPEKPHSVVFDSTTGLIADLSTAHVTFFDRANTRYKDPVPFVGRPKSVAYDPTHGYMVIYDDMNTVGLIQTDGNGAPLRAWAGGPVLQDDSQVVSGDLTPDGSLILSLSSGLLARVDVAASLTQKRWVFTTVSPGLGSFVWVAPVTGFTDRVLVLTSDQKLALVSLTNGSVLASKTIDGRVALESKSKDAHVVGSSGGTLTAYYTDGTAIHTRSVSWPSQLILSSRLCVDQDSWTLVNATTDISYRYPTGGADETPEYAGRVLRKFRLSDSLGLRISKLPESAQLDISEKYVFAIYPNAPFGYAERLSTNDDSRAQIKMFNFGYIHN